MKINCPSPVCSLAQLQNPQSNPVVRNGSFFRKSDSRRIRRFYCNSCGKNFSHATLSPCYRQKKRRINHSLKQLLCSGVSQRRAAKILRVNPKTVVRRFRFLALQAKIEHENWLQQYRDKPIHSIQFDDLETSEHTKCKPLSVSIAIEPIHRKILSFKVSQMPAKGLLSKKALKKYGYRADKRPEAWNELMRELTSIVNSAATFTSDENPHYSKHLFRHHPTATHIQVPGGRGASTGQGELKRLRFDPIFSLNHTCAMLRANLNRLFRRTWCTTKNIQGLRDHISLYVTYHNLELTPSATKGGS